MCLLVITNNYSNTYQIKAKRSHIRLHPINAQMIERPHLQQNLTLIVSWQLAR
jgi:hypothetical protein